MATTLEEVLRSFEALAEDDKHRVAAKILRWSADGPHPALTGDELTAAANEIFLGYDREEQGRE